MADEPSPGELARRLDRAERDRTEAESRLRTEHSADIQRLEREHAEELRRLRGDVIRPLADRVAALERLKGMTFGRWIGVLGVVAAFAGVLVTAWAVSKGASH